MNVFLKHKSIREDTITRGILTQVRCNAVSSYKSSWKGICPSSLSQCIILPAGAQLCPSGSQIFCKFFLGCSRRHLGHKGWQKKAHGVKREEAGTEETLLCSLVVARARAEAEPAGWEERMTAIRLAGNSQAVLNTTTADTWPSSEDRTEPIKHCEGQNLG